MDSQLLGNLAHALIQTQAAFHAHHQKIQGIRQTQENFFLVATLRP